MVETKSKIAEIILFLYFILFPFGQIIRFEASLSGTKIPLHPIDFVAASGLLLWILFKLKTPQIAKYFKNFFWVVPFSLLYSLTIFEPSQIFIGLAYFLRLISYFSLFLTAWNLTKKKAKIRCLLGNAMIVVTIFSAIFSWIQYVFYPDLRALLFWGWDDHLFRMSGTFLDPGFLSIILVLGAILSLANFFEKDEGKFLFISLFLLASIAFTYSRAGYLAFIAGISVLGITMKKIPVSLFLIFTFSFLILVLPRPSSEGVKLERLSSVYPRISSYREAFEIIKKYPLFGVGYNNLCAVRGKNPSESHSCAGADSSILTILTTTGIIGLFYFINLVVGIMKNLDYRNVYGLAFLSCLIALGANSLFINSLFYPWVMGYLTILLGLAVRE